MDVLMPVKLEKWEGQGITIHWSDGHVSRYRSGWLRVRCPCAACREKETQAAPTPTGLKLLRTIDPSSEQLAGLEPVGQYAYNVTFKDGHGSGIYSFDYLRGICECDECRPGAL
jgi:DUF971 family protein